MFHRLSLLKLRFCSLRDMRYHIMECVICDIAFQDRFLLSQYWLGQQPHPSKPLLTSKNLVDVLVGFLFFGEEMIVIFFLPSPTSSPPFFRPMSLSPTRRKVEYPQSGTPSIWPPKKIWTWRFLDPVTFRRLGVMFWLQSESQFSRVFQLSE